MASTDAIGSTGGNTATTSTTPVRNVTPSLRTEDTPISSTTTTKQNAEGAADRFLKLLVAQMQNQDPLKPMDNAQITSQMAQIQTVSGIENLNKSISAMSASFTLAQNMQGAALVGRGVFVDGNALTVDKEGYVQGGFELDAPADTVRVDILSAAGAVVGSVPIGAETNGRHTFAWKVPENVDPAKVASFKVVARANAAEVKSTPLQHEIVASVVTGGTTLMLELQSGAIVPYTQVKTFN